MLHPRLVQFSGWLPAIIIPVATIIQLSTIIKNRSARGVSGLTWALFGIANVGLYLYTEKYADIQSIAGLLGSAVLDFIIAGLALCNYGRYNADLEDPAKLRT